MIIAEIIVLFLVFGLIGALIVHEYKLEQKDDDQEDDDE